MIASKPFLIALALMTPSAALAQVNSAASTAPDFRQLWTGWSRVNGEAMTTETRSIEQVRQDVATADAARLRQLGNQGRALGERVGEIVRLGDCEDGERVARQAGDFALVEAVREHCRRAAAADSAPSR
jgi:hypothetical protein